MLTTPACGRCCESAGTDVVKRDTNPKPFEGDAVFPEEFLALQNNFAWVWRRTKSSSLKVPP